MKTIPRRNILRASRIPLVLSACAAASGFVIAAEPTADTEITVSAERPTRHGDRSYLFRWSDRAVRVPDRLSYEDSISPQALAPMNSGRERSGGSFGLQRSRQAPSAEQAGRVLCSQDCRQLHAAGESRNLVGAGERGRKDEIARRIRRKFERGLRARLILHGRPRQPPARDQASADAPEPAQLFCRGGS